MNAVEFINKCDWEGGLGELFDTGVIPQQVEMTVDPELRQVIYRAYDGWKMFKDAADEYYTLVETGKY